MSLMDYVMIYLRMNVKAGNIGTATGIPHIMVNQSALGENISEILDLAKNQKTLSADT